MFITYIKKSDVKETLNKYNLASAFTFFGIAGALIVIQLLVSPKIYEMYADLGVELSLATMVSAPLSWLMASLSFGYGAYLLTRKVDYSILESKLSKYQDNDMINSREIINYNKIVVTYLICTVIIMFVIASYILPIYNLTAIMK